MFTREERAKQFLSFDALSGFYQYIKEKENIKEERIELAEDEKEEIERVLNELDIGDKVNVRCYDGNNYINKKGTVTQINSIRKFFILEDSKVKFCDILKISDV